jgi:hypothetical protein
MFMKRRELLEMPVRLGSATALLVPLSMKAARAEPSATKPAATPNPLRPPAEGDIPVAFLAKSDFTVGHSQIIALWRV